MRILSMIPLTQPSRYAVLALWEDSEDGYWRGTLEPVLALALMEYDSGDRSIEPVAYDSGEETFLALPDLMQMGTPHEVFRVINTEAALGWDDVCRWVARAQQIIEIRERTKQKRTERA
jgi:hypothetical protein